MGCFGIGLKKPGTDQRLVEHSATMSNRLDACYIFVLERYYGR
jgi:hypothetical protein